jgi:hypothetical protein
MRVEGAGRKILDKEMETKLLNWIFQQRQRKIGVTRGMAKIFAKQNSSCPEFKASSCWLKKLMKRNSLSFRKKTTTCQKLPSDFIEKIVNFVLYISKLRTKFHYELRNILACDETAVFIDAAMERTIEATGAKEVIVRSTGHEKVNITVMLTAQADGTKLVPYVILRRKTPIKELEKKYQNNIKFAYDIAGWTNNDLAIDFVNTVIGQKLFQKRMLVWDCQRSHISESTKKEFRNKKIDMVVVPAGCTKYVQPADLSWNKPFKAQFREFYNNWMATGEMSTTIHGNLRHASWDLVCDWIIKSWDSVSKEVIIQSFKSCGITTNVDGSEDGLITCLKPGRSCADGIRLLGSKRHDLTELEQIMTSDPEEDFSNENPVDSEDEEEICDADQSDVAESDDSDNIPPDVEWSD